MINKVQANVVERVVLKIERLESYGYKIETLTIGGKFQINATYSEKIICHTSHMSYVQVEQELNRLIDEYNRMPRPDWTKAPDWAMYWAVDWNGRSYWYKDRPTAIADVWASRGELDSDRTVLNLSEFSWTETLHKRPKR